MLILSAFVPLERLERLIYQLLYTYDAVFPIRINRQVRAIRQERIEHILLLQTELEKSSAELEDNKTTLDTLRAHIEWLNEELEREQQGRDASERQVQSLRAELEEEGQLARGVMRLIMNAR